MVIYCGKVIEKGQIWMDIVKPKLSVDEQIEHLKSKGVLFNIMDEEEAKDYLRKHNNYFKLTAYRKNYPKHPDGENKDKYIKLEFAYLVDIAIVDMKLRYQIVHMALDIEHHVKLQLLQKIDSSNEDGYEIVKDFIDSLLENQRTGLLGEISRNENSIYCGNIINKYDPNYPIWAFLEIIPFGRVISFYGFCADRFHDKKMKDTYYQLLTCKEIRNAAAHSNCVLNDLKSGTAKHSTSNEVTNELAKIKEISKGFRYVKMSNARIQQVVTLLYVHKNLVVSEGIRKNECAELIKITDRMFQNNDYYQKNDVIKGTFNFLKLVVDNWFSMA